MSDQNRLKKIIKIKKKSNFLNHLMSFLFYGSSSWFGEIDQQKIKLWQPRFTGIFYTVFSLEFDSKGKLIKIKDNLNPAGKIIFILSFLLLFYGILPKNISDTTNKIFWFILLIFVLLGCLILAVAVLVYRFEKNKQLKKIMRVIEVEIKEQIIKEWSFTSLLTRLFTYPFSLFIVWLNFKVIIPDKSYFLAIVSLLFVVVYILSDVFILFKKK